MNNFENTEDRFKSGREEKRQIIELCGYPPVLVEACLSEGKYYACIKKHGGVYFNSASEINKEWVLLYVLEGSDSSFHEGMTVRLTEIVFVAKTVEKVIHWRS